MSDKYISKIFNGTLKIMRLMRLEKGLPELKN